MTKTNSQPLVSIVTPSYNQAKYLEKTVRSVLEQDYPVLEYFVVDGGSTDGSAEIIRDYSSQLSWWVSEPDRGQADAINKGLSRARGDVVAWLNSDDLYLPGTVARAVRAFQANPHLGMVYGNAITIDSQGRPINKLEFPDWGLEDLIGFRIICQPSVFMRREVLKRVGFLDDSYQFMLDHHLWLRIGIEAQIEHIPEIWAAARHHPEAKNVAQAEKFGLEVFRILEWMQTQQVLMPLLERNRRQVLAGAHRLNARYLLDGGFPGAALKAYGQALLARPGFAIRHWHRMLFAMISLLGADGLADWYYKFRKRRDLDLDNISGLEDWPGLVLEVK